jgi:hypothetical protein
MQEELIKKIDKQIEGQDRFIRTLENFLVFEQAMERERLRRETMDELSKKMTGADEKY